MENKFTELASCFPSGTDAAIDWNGIENDPRLFPLISRMRSTAQEPAYHHEGDVWEHTRLTCEALAAQPAFRALDQRKQAIVFTAALLHDTGKISRTTEEGGRIVSPGHAAAGARMTRALLWKDFGMCGTQEALRFREAVCALIRFHTVPPHIIDEDAWNLKLRRIASIGELVPEFSISLLCLLCEADIRGRIATDQDELVERNSFTAGLAAEAGCLKTPGTYASAHTRFTFLSGHDVPPDYPLFDDTWGEITLLSGLPGTGKDTWIHEHCPDMPIISLDEIRREIGVQPTDPQGKVADEAISRARDLLRRKVPFVWNATNISIAQREKPLSLFHAYHASARVIYLETEWEELLRRNRSRPNAVPEPIIEELVLKTTPPSVDEAREVSWFCV